MKIKRFLRRLFEPIQLLELLVFAFFIFLCIFLISVLNPSSLSNPELLDLFYSLDFSPCQSISIFAFASVSAGLIFIFAVSLFSNLILLIFDYFKKRRSGPDSVKDNRIEVYVDDVTFDRLNQIIEGHNVELPEFCSMVLESVDPVELDAALSDPEV